VFPTTQRIRWTLAVAATVAAAYGHGLAQDKAGGIWSGVYSDAQADRGKTPYTTVCRRCHNDDLGGSERGPALRGEQFIANWDGQGLNRLFAKIKDTMPPDSPSSLPDEDYLDLVTVILKTNGFPAGNATLTPEKLEDVLIMKKADGGTADVPNFRLVQVVGCLAEGPDNTWVLTRTSAPAVASDQVSSAAALKEAAVLPLGSQTFRLLSENPFHPEAHRGHKMQAKGLIYRAPNKDRINLVSLEMVSPSCGS
jgi:mono/diheme cytochrome c family protein